MSANSWKMAGLKVALSLIFVAIVWELWGWKMAAAIFVAIYIHERGHIWALKRAGLETKGVFFIPMFGAVTLLKNDEFPSLQVHSRIAIMGPLWGLLQAGLFTALYLATHQTGFLAFALVAAFINLLNLIPLFPFDGGVIVRSAVLSSGPFVKGFYFTLLVVGAFFAIWWKMWFVLALVLFEVMETAKECFRENITMTTGQSVRMTAMYLCVSGGMFAILYYLSELPASLLVKNWWGN